MSDNRKRGWCFTLNNYDESHELVMYDMSQQAKYFCCGKEVGESGTPHFQGCIYFENKKSFSQVKDLLPEAHWEPMKGTCEQASEYCKKDGDYYEDGEMPMTQKTKGVKGKEAILERWEKARQGRFDELPPEQIKTYEYIYRKYTEVHDRDELDNLWICGPSGCGKSRWSRSEHPGCFVKSMTKWWDGYNHEDVVLLEDFDPRHSQYLAYYLKIWTDHYTFPAEVKGGTMKIRPKKFIVTSQYTLNECFENEDFHALSRRFKIVSFFLTSERSEGCPQNGGECETDDRL